MAVKTILVVGAGRIGTLLAHLFAHTGDYHVIILDGNAEALHTIATSAQLTTKHADINDDKAMLNLFEKTNLTAVVSCLPYYCNLKIAELAKIFQVHYFDLTEDVATTKAIKKLASDAGNVFAPGCGLAPGFVNIVAHSLMQNFTELHNVKLRVGCLPLITDNALQYALTWSTDGIINEYGNLCSAIMNGQRVTLPPLENCETVELDGILYEAFNTSGGIGTLVDSYIGKVRNLNYKTIRYPGHCEKVRFLMNDLKLNEDRATLKRILENALPRITEDVTLIYVAVTGMRDNQLAEEVYVNKIYPQTLFNKKWTSIQVTTAASASVVIDSVLQHPQKYAGFVLQEQFLLADFLKNRFGNVYERKTR